MGNDGRLLKNDLMNLAAIKVTGNQVDFTNFSTSDPSVAGRLWNDSGTVKISAEIIRGDKNGNFNRDKTNNYRQFNILC